MSLYDDITLVKQASTELSVCDEKTKNEILLSFAAKLMENENEILDSNKKDIAEAKKSGLKEAFIDRLTLTHERIYLMAQGVEKVAALCDPVGITLEERTLDCGLFLKKISVPLGVIGIIFEARPNVSADSMALCIKSGNACVLRGGKEALNTNLAIIAIMRQTLRKIGLNENFVYLVEDISHSSAEEMMKMNGLIDVLIPRGGKNLINTVVKNSTVPVIETGAGNCHAYVDKDANLNLALNVCISAKISRPSVCNSLEKILVNKDIANEFVPLLKEKCDKFGVELRGCPQTLSILEGMATLATEEDWYEEYNDLIVGVKIVESTEEAIAHIRNYSTHHSEVIFTQNENTREHFFKNVDSAAVYSNASTRFTDGGVFGLGAEIGISTQKLHARGPMGLRELTSYKYIIYGNGETR